MVIFCPAHSTCVHSLEFFCKQYFSLLPHLFSQAFLSMAGSSMESHVRARLWGPECGSFTAAPWPTGWMVVRNNSYLAWEGLRTPLSSQRGVGPYLCLHRLLHILVPQSQAAGTIQTCAQWKGMCPSIHPVVLTGCTYRGCQKLLILGSTPLSQGCFLSYVREVRRSFTHGHVVGKRPR